MNAERLLAHYEQIADAPDAISRLRRFILDLAVRGKLVPQDPKDEPASELLMRIAQEKARRVKEGVLRDQKPLPPIESDEREFELPEDWQWVRMAEVIKLWNGFAFKSGDFQADGVPVIRIGDLQGGEVTLSSAACVSEAIAKTVGAEVWIPPDALLIAMSGATTGKTAFNRTGKPLLLNQRVGRIEVFSISVNFLRFFFETIVARNLSISFGTAIPNLSAQQINETVVPLPPLAEQHRIVAKVDELMALCDRLEAARAEREATRVRLAASSLARLNAPDPETFQDDARFVLNALPALTTRPDQIKQLRQTILNLAVRGKLVPQDPKDEPASELFKRIKVEKARLLKAGKLKRTKEFEPLSSKADLIELPRGWEVVRLGSAYDVRDGTHDTPKYVDVGFPLITSKNLSSGYLSFADVKLISEQDHQQISERSRVDNGDVLLAMIGSIGNPVVVDTDRSFSIKNVALFKYYDRDLSSPSFLRYFLQDAANQMKDLAAGGLQPFVSLGFLRAYPIALPPLSEQHRIVAKVDELMALCDQLEASLTDTAATRRRLLDALLAEALEPAEVREVEAVA